MKKLILLALFFFTSLVMLAQKTETSYLDSLNTKPIIVLDAGDYLIKASDNLWVSVISAGLSTAFFAIYIDNINQVKDFGPAANNSGKDMAIFPAVGFGVISLVKIVSIPINLKKAGKAYKRDMRK